MRQTYLHHVICLIGTIGSIICDNHVLTVCVSIFYLFMHQLTEHFRTFHLFCIDDNFLVRDVDPTCELESTPRCAKERR
jgi:hypothetical protein